MRRFIFKLDNVLLSVKLQLTTVDPLIEYAGIKYWSLFHATSLFDSRKQASIVLISLKGSDLYDYYEKPIVFWFKLFAVTFFLYI